LKIYRNSMLAKLAERCRGNGDFAVIGSHSESDRGMESVHEHSCHGAPIYISECWNFDIIM
jgi:hypothetical protein